MGVLSTNRSTNMASPSTYLTLAVLVVVGSLIYNTNEVSGQCGGSVKIIKIRSNFCSTIKIHPDFIAYLIKHQIHLIKKQCIDKLGHWIIGQTWLLPKIAFCTFSDFFFIPFEITIPEAERYNQLEMYFYSPNWSLGKQKYSAGSNSQLGLVFDPNTWKS